MQYKLNYQHRSEEEEIKDAGMVLDLDEVARKGGLSSSEKLILKWYGIYASRQPGSHMARIVMPGGVMTSTQARNIAFVAEKYAQGRMNITTRQAVQLHWLKVGDLADMLRDLAQDGNTTMHGCGDVTRTIPACPLAETCVYRRTNVIPYAQRMFKYLGDAKDLENLPRKFKFTFSGCGANCAQPYINCVGVTAVQRRIGTKETVGFQFVIGGGLGWKPFIAQPLFTWVPEDRILQVGRAIALLYRDHGDRFNRSTSRLKFVVDRLGIEECRKIVLENLEKEKVSTDGLEWTPFQETGRPFPQRPLTEEDPIGTDGLASVRAMIPMGELGYRDFKRFAELSEIYGNQKVYTTNRQNIELRGIEPRKIAEVKAEIQKMGYATDGFFGLKDIVPCVGTTYCPKAVTETRDLYSLVLDVVKKPKFQPIDKAGIIHVTGCPNSCSPYRIADIGFRGMRIREDLGSVEGYEMLVGGDQQDLGKKFGEFKKDDIPGIVERLLDYFMEKRQGGETIRDFVNRTGVETLQEVVLV